jgi:hypothetical protein
MKDTSGSHGERSRRNEVADHPEDTPDNGPASQADFERGEWRDSYGTYGFRGYDESPADAGPRSGSLSASGCRWRTAKSYSRAR